MKNPEGVRALIAKLSHRPFEYGVHDCVVFVAACVEASTGTALRPDLREPYGSKAQAYRALSKFGSLVELWSLVFQTPPKRDFKDGDVVVLRIRNWFRPCIEISAFVLDGKCWLTHYDGVKSIRARSVIAAWSVN